MRPGIAPDYYDPNYLSPPSNYPFPNPHYRPFQIMPPLPPFVNPDEPRPFPMPSYIYPHISQSPHYESPYLRNNFLYHHHESPFLPHRSPFPHHEFLNRPHFMPFPPRFGPHGPILNIQKKKTIENLTQFIEEKELTKTILEKGEQKSCTICLEDFAIGNKIIYLPCFHYYHSKCIDTWVKTSNKCPLCNIEIKINQ